MKKLIAVFISVIILFEFLTIPVSCLTLSESLLYLEEMENGLGIGAGTVEIIPLGYEDVLKWGYDPDKVVGWTPMTADKIYINAYYIADADYIWTIAHELTHIKQMREGNCIITDRDYYLQDNYSDLPFEVEAESVAAFYFFYFNFGKGATWITY